MDHRTARQPYELLRGMGEDLLSLVCESASQEQLAAWLRVPLEHAAARGDVACVEKLTAAVADPRTARRSSVNVCSPFQAAPRAGSEGVVTVPLGSGAKPDGKHWGYLANSKGNGGGGDGSGTGSDFVKGAQAQHSAGSSYGADAYGTLVSSEEDGNGWSPLHCAASQGHLVAVRALLRAGAALDVADDEGAEWRRAVSLFRARGHPSFPSSAERACVCRPSPSLERPRLPTCTFTETCWHAIHGLAFSCGACLVPCLLHAPDRGESSTCHPCPSPRDAVCPMAMAVHLHVSPTPGHVAPTPEPSPDRWWGHGASCARMLGASRPDLFATPSLTRMLCCSGVMRFQCFHVANAGSTALHLAVFRGYSEVVEELVAAGAAVDTHDNEGETPLHSAAGQGNLAMVRAILQACPEVVNGSGGVHLKLSPLHRAALGGHLAVMRELLAHGACLESLACNARTALHACAMSGSAEAVRLLLSKQVDMEVPDHEGCTALHIAAGHRLGSEVTLESLLQAGANMEARTIRGETALHRACKALRVHSVKMLLQWGANEDAVDLDGRTPAFVVSQLLETQSPGVFRDRLDDILIMLANAPVDRIWRRRGWLIILRARRQRQARTSCRQPKELEIYSTIHGGMAAAATFAKCRRKEYRSEGSTCTVRQACPTYARSGDAHSTWSSTGWRDGGKQQAPVPPEVTGHGQHGRAWDVCSPGDVGRGGGVAERAGRSLDEELPAEGDGEAGFRSVVTRIVKIHEDGVFRSVMEFL